MEPKDRLIVALDLTDLEAAKPLVMALAPHVGHFKIGLELITAVGGPAAVALVKAAGGKVMYDAKFHDIPNTMEGAAKSVARQGAEMFTVHASAGAEAIRAAVHAAPWSVVIGVTVLTSLDDERCIEIFGDRPSAKVRAFARSLVDAGAAAVVCSPQEVGSLVDLQLLRITPGVRPSWAGSDDQKRFMTPGDAIRAGADMLVVGRPILRPPSGIGSPVEAARRVLDEIAESSP